MQPQNTQKHTADRVEFVDTLRGFALLGVFGANLLIFSGFSYYMSDAQRAMLPTANADNVVYLLKLIFIDTKFIGLFSFLFGVSFWLFLSRANARGVGGTRLFYRRLGWLFVIGSIHGWLFWCFDILRFYALWGLLLPLFLPLSGKMLLSFALLFAVLAPALISGFQSLAGPVATDPNIDAVALQTFSSGSYAEVLRVNWLYDWHLTLSVGEVANQVAILGRLLLGLCAARALVLVDLKGHHALFRTLLIVGAIVGIGGNIIFAGKYLDSAAVGSFPISFIRRFTTELGSLGLTLAYASGLAFLFQKSRWGRYLLLLAPVGRMALTCYLLQTLFGLWLFYGFMPGPDLMGKVGPVWLVLVWVSGYAVQVWFASLWLRHFRFGPAEWLWRSLTYWKIQPLRLAARPAV